MFLRHQLTTGGLYLLYWATGGPPSARCHHLPKAARFVCADWVIV